MCIVWQVHRLTCVSFGKCIVWQVHRLTCVSFDNCIFWQVYCLTTAFLTIIFLTIAIFFDHHCCSAEHPHTGRTSGRGWENSGRNGERACQGPGGQRRSIGRQPRTREENARGVGQRPHCLWTTSTRSRGNFVEQRFIFLKDFHFFEQWFIFFFSNFFARHVSRNWKHKWRVPMRWSTPTHSIRSKCRRLWRICVLQWNRWALRPNDRYLTV